MLEIIADPLMAISASATKLIQSLFRLLFQRSKRLNLLVRCRLEALSIAIRVEYSLNGTTYQTLNSFSGLVPNNYVLYVRNVADNSCVSQSVSSTKIDPLPALPVVPTVDLLLPTCGVQTGTIKLRNNVQYSIGAGIKTALNLRI
jgi:hypothetical protein